MQDRHMFSELDDTLGVLGFDARVDSVEKVLMGVPKDLLFGTWLLEHGAVSDRRLPFDAMTWLHLAPASSSTSP